MPPQAAHHNRPPRAQMADAPPPAAAPPAAKKQARRKPTRWQRFQRWAVLRYDRAIVATWERVYGRGNGRPHMPSSTPGVPLEDVLPTLRTGDVVLTRNSENARRAGAVAYSGCPFAHCGLIYVHETSQKRTVFIFDTASYRMYDFNIRPLDFDAPPSPEWWTGSGPVMYDIERLRDACLPGGTGLRPARRRDGSAGPAWRVERVSVRRLKTPLTPAQLASLEDFIREIRDVPFQRDRDEVFNALNDCCDCLGCNRNKVETLDSVFCGELNAASYQRVGLLPPFPVGPPSNEYVPGDFSQYAAGNTAAACGCCLPAWGLARLFGLGELRGPDGKALFGDEIAIAWGGL